MQRKGEVDMSLNKLKQTWKHLKCAYVGKIFTFKLDMSSAKLVMKPDLDQSWGLHFKHVTLIAFLNMCNQKGSRYIFACNSVTSATIYSKFIDIITCYLKKM
jgi:hypothetical protein